jgi:hypothetical protein
MSLSSALPVLVFLLAVTQASPSWTTGNTTANPPFQISAKAFTTSIHKYNAGIAGLIPGYDTSLPPSNTTPPHTNSSSSSGQSRYWYLKAVLAVNAPLSDSSAPAQEVDKQKFTQLTAIGLDSNANTTIDEAGWRVCATVFTGGVAGSRDVGFNPSPSCDRWLSKECQRAMRESAGKSPLGGDGKCRGIDLPAECGAVGGGGGEQVTTRTSLFSFLLSMSCCYLDGDHGDGKTKRIKKKIGMADWNRNNHGHAR